MLRAARASTEGRSSPIVQPHRYTRLHTLFDQFCTCFNDADTVIVADVYAAGEQPIPGADRDSLVQGLKARGHRHVHARWTRPEDIAGIVRGIAKPGDYVVCLGAGNITHWAYALPGELAALEGDDRLGPHAEHGRCRAGALDRPCCVARSSRDAPLARPCPGSAPAGRRRCCSRRPTRRILRHFLAGLAGTCRSR